METVLQWEGFGLIILIAGVLTAVGVIWTKIKPIIKKIEDTNEKSSLMTMTLLGTEPVKDPLTGEILQEAIKPLAVRMRESERKDAAMMLALDALKTNVSDLSENQKKLITLNEKFSQHDEWSHIEHKEFRDELDGIKKKLESR